MTIRELKELDDKDIRKFAYESLYIPRSYPTPTWIAL